MTTNANRTIQENSQIRDLALAASAGRERTQPGQGMVREHIQGKVILVTGVAGTVGSELCRQIASLGPVAVVGFDQAETPLFHLQRNLARDFPNLAFYPEIGSVVSFKSIAWVMERYQPSIVYHGAAYKHVPFMESQLFAAVENNIFGTRNVARAAALHGVEYCVLISTDKAVRPASVMGATKRVAEMVMHELQRPTGTRFLVVRFGNVFGSNGSVVPFIKEQIAAGVPVTVTHPGMERYFMTAADAAELLLESVVLGRGGEIFVLDMGKSVSILELAEDLIRLSGRRPGIDVPIEFTGIRPGEKLFEELNLQSQYLAPTAHPRIRSLKEHVVAEKENLSPLLLELEQALETRNSPSLLRLLQALIADYCPGETSSRDLLPKHSGHAAGFGLLNSSSNMACQH